MIKRNDLIGNVLIDIDKGIKKGISADILAKKYSLSEVYLRRLYKFTIKQPIANYIRSRKLTISLGDLLKTESNLSDIAIYYGFSCKQCYIRAFRREFGITPGAFRETSHVVKINWIKSRKGKWIVGRKTDSKRLSRAITAISAWCKANRHKAMQEQWETLKAKITGHYAYYGISLNYRSIAKFYVRVQEVWRGWLNRRGRKGSCNWKSFSDYLKDWHLPEPRIMHSYC